VRQAGAGEYRQLLAADQGVQAVDGGNAGLDELGGVVAGGGVHGQAVDVAVSLGQYLGAAVDGLAHAVEDAAQHILGNASSSGWPRKRTLDCARLMPCGGFEQLDDSLVALDLEDLAAADFRRGSSISASSS
jgi:hypothetical protein